MTRKFLAWALLSGGLLLFPSPSVPAESRGLSIVGAPRPAVLFRGVTFDLGKIIRVVLESNQDIVSASYDVAMTDTSLEMYKKRYALFVNASAAHREEKFPGSLALFNGSKKTTEELGVSLGKSFGTGTRVGTGVSYERGRAELPSFSLGGDGESFSLGESAYHQPIFYVSLQQDLLKNSFGMSERETLDILENQGRMQKQTAIFMLSGLVTKTLIDFWSVSLRKQSLLNARTLRDETQLLRDIVAENARLGTAESYNVNYMNASLAGSRIRELEARRTFEADWRDFLAALGMPEGSLDIDRLYLVTELPALDVEAAVKTALAQRADYQAALLDLENARKGMKIARNDALPSLSLGLSARGMGRDTGFGDAWGDVGEWRNPSYEARLDLSLSLFDAERKVTARNSRFLLQKALTDRAHLERKIRSEVRTALDRVRYLHEVCQHSRKAREEAEQAYRKMTEAYRYGRMSTQYLKDALDAMIQAREGEMASLVGYNVALIQWEVVQNRLWDTLGIDVETYIPKDVEGWKAGKGGGRCSIRRSPTS